MIERKDLVRIREQFENNPSLLKNDKRFAELFMVSRNVENLDISIQALDAIVEGGNQSYLTGLKNAWSAFMKNAILPTDSQT
jgi:hypothetical protein